jgi:hypothetical protein
MRRDFTIGLSLIVLLIWIVGAVTGHIPNEIVLSSDQSTAVKAFGTLGVLSILRLMILFLQTLIYAAHNASRDSKTGLIIFHLILGPVISVPYYYSVRRPRNGTQAEQVAPPNP